MEYEWQVVYYFHKDSSPLSPCGTSFEPNPFFVTRHVIQCSKRPGGPIRFVNNTEWEVNMPEQRGKKEEMIKWVRESPL